MEERLSPEEKAAQNRRREELKDIRSVLANISGRRLLWRFMESCGVFSSTFSQEGTMMSYLSGQQDIGHFIMSEIVEADENLLFKMMKENKRKTLKEINDGN